MVRMSRSQRNLARVAPRLIVAVTLWAGLAVNLHAEPPAVHYNHAGIMPPGAIGRGQLERGGPLPGYFQPVEIKAPLGASISIADSGQFAAPQAGPLIAGMLIGSVYRLRVTNIPLQEGLEVYPTIEVIDRTYPPLGQEFRFPIPIELTQDEIEMALDGKFVTRVIYLENPEAALPVAQKSEPQSFFEVAEDENPLEVADSLGRPMAILRMGGRLPSSDGPDETFLFGSPPMLKWTPAEAPPRPLKPSKLPRASQKIKPASAVGSTLKLKVQGSGTP